MKTLKFTLRGDYAQFRKLETAAVMRTYSTITKPQVMGLLAAIIGRGRDEYYDEFKEADFETSIVPKNIEKETIPQLYLTTNDEGMGSIGNMNLVTDETSRKENRQRISIEHLVNPVFEIYVRMDENTELYTEIKERLSNGTSHFTPSLGKSEFVAEVEFNGEFDSTDCDEEEVVVDSICPEFKIKEVSVYENADYNVEKHPHNYTKENGQRKTQDYINIVTNQNEQGVKIVGPYSKVDDKKLLFY